jgi:hypothetical protein
MLSSRENGVAKEVVYDLLPGSPGFPVEIRGVDQSHAAFLRKTAYVEIASNAK